MAAVRSSTVTSASTSGSPPSTYWQNDSATVFCVGLPGARPWLLSQKERTPSTTVMNASGAPVTRWAIRVSRSKDSSAAAASNWVARTAANCAAADAVLRSAVASRSAVGRAHSRSSCLTG
ncbi:hypothetical protein [Geodermatophilus siccatus]|uniref:hypothetical protein n=1 Tax=Geodermatophilus siccatus TaxID=1137991 RepID=UPI0011142013|nr:hypothetical protein [Geodermatophilus siccatus]